MPYLLNVAYLLLLLVLSPWLVYKSLTTRKYRRGFVAKFLGRGIRRDSNRPCVWFHGVSVGEIHLLKPLVALFRQRHPDWDCIISSTTDTGYDEARKRFADLPVFFWPLDFSWAVKAALANVRPTLVVLAESELWPNFLMAAQRHCVPVAVINGRMSPRSFEHWTLILGKKNPEGSLRSPEGLQAPGRAKRVLGVVGGIIRPLLRRVLDSISLWAVQTDDYAACYRALGVPGERVNVTGSIKYDGVNGDRSNPQTRDLARLFDIADDDLVWIAGSTQDPEEQIVLDLFRKARQVHPRLRLFVVPRQRERFEEVAQLLEKSGSPFVRRSRMDNQEMKERPIVLVDTIGELSALWGLAHVAFVGGSLDGRRGGQNMIEPASYGAAVTFGPHVWNFRDTAARLVDAGAAIQINDAAELEMVVLQLLADADERARLGNAAKEFVSLQQGATAKTVDLLDQLIPKLARHAA
jgi:3-deoxy-D-manno-octulosonic-acid transferase